VPRLEVQATPTGVAFFFFWHGAEMVDPVAAFQAISGTATAEYSSRRAAAGLA